jgi:CheY-like chemotaxis protein
MIRKALIIDDDPDLVAATRFILEKNNFKVVATEELSRAPQIIATEKPDVIILDIMFGENSSGGIDLCRTLKEDPHFSHIPIIMFTSINQKFPIDIHQDETWLPADSFLDKSSSKETLLSAIENILRV